MRGLFSEGASKANRKLQKLILPYIKIADPLLTVSSPLEIQTLPNKHTS